MRYSEYTLQEWTRPLSESEKERVENTIGMVRDALGSSANMLGLEYEVFAQGSFANNTNVRRDSDIDICVMLTSTFYSKYPTGWTRKDYGFTAGTISDATYNEYITDALKKKFGYNTVTIGNKSIKISATSYRVNADVVPAFQYRDYACLNSYDPNFYVEGIKYYAKDNTEVINYPKRHIENGKEKNENTHHYYKRLVRIMKHILNNMISDGMADGEKITSFLMECLIWNVPNNYIMNCYSWEQRIKQAIGFLSSGVCENNRYKNWCEVSGMTPLFHSGRKWTSEDVLHFLQKMYIYLNF